MTDATTTGPPSGPVAASRPGGPRFGGPRNGGPRFGMPRVGKHRVGGTQGVGGRGRHDADQVRRLRALQVIVLVVVIVSTLGQHPRAGLHGSGLGVTIALGAYVAGSLALLPRGFADVPTAVVIGVLVGMGAAGVVLAGLQPEGAGEIPATAPVLLASIRLPPGLSRVVVVPVVVALAVVVSSQADVENAVGSVLLCVVLAVLGRLFREIRSSRDRTEQLLDELEGARDEEARAAALAERSRIARELHDVLAHSLSGLSIQLEGARKLAATAGAPPELGAVIDRSAALAKAGLVEARNAVSELRQDDLMTVGQLPRLVEHYRRDLGLPVELDIEGEPRPLPDEVSLTLYRTVGEALTNVMRHAPGAATRVQLRWAPAEVHLRVSDDGRREGPALVDHGSGWGLVGMRERVARVQGRCAAGPAGEGWAVDVTVPA